MSEAIVVALITGAVTALCTWMTVRSGNQKLLMDMKTEYKTQQAVQDEKIAELTREVRMHNEFAIRIPVLEEKIRQFEAKNRVNP